MRAKLQGELLILYNATEIVSRTLFSARIRLNQECVTPLAAKYVILCT